MSSFFFYDLETSGISPRSARIMQFAGQRTDENLNPIGEPYNILIKLSDDVLPEPDAILVTGITPQKTLSEGITEAEFCKLFYDEIVAEGTTFMGFNSVRFDDEFMRFLFYRNFYDPYEWQWKDSSSRWDLIDVVRMTRALRPEGINWPFASDGKATNRLELLTDLNGLDHVDAHDALSDVHATIAVAKLIREKQPKLFDYLFSMRSKRDVEKLAMAGQPFLYVSGKYDAAYEKLAIVYSLGVNPDKHGSLVYDLRHDPSQWLDMSVAELVEAWRYKKDSDDPRLPVKTLQYNRCPAVAPLGVLNEENKERLQIDLDEHMKHKKILTNNPEFYTKLCEALKQMNQSRSEQSALIPDETAVDEQLYEGFIKDNDKAACSQLRSADPTEINNFVSKFNDARLKLLVPLYKARNYPRSLTDDERSVWEAHRVQSIQKRLPGVMSRMQALASGNLSSEQQYLLEEIQLYIESILPEA